MRVFMIIESLLKGGKERRLLELLKYFDKESLNIEVTLVLLKDQIDYPVAKELKKTKIIVFKRKIKKDFTVFFKLSKLLKKVKPDLVHSWGSMPSTYVAPLCYLNKIPFLNAMVADSHFPVLGKTWIRAKLTYPFSDCILSNSYSGLVSYKVPFHKGKVIYNGVHLERFVVKSSEESTRNKFNISTKYVIGMIAAFHPRKDYKTFIKAAIDIAKRNNDITFVTVGEGPLLDNIKKMVPAIYSNRILFLGKQDHVEELIQIFDIGVLTSYTEGISNVVMEYMAMGKPVIATYGGGTPEILDSNINGFIIQNENVTELVDKIETLLADSEKRKLFGLNGKSKIEAGFSIDIMAMNYIELYDNLTKKGKVRN